MPPFPSAAAPAPFFRTCRPCRGGRTSPSPSPRLRPLHAALSGVTGISSLWDEGRWGFRHSLRSRRNGDDNQLTYKVEGEWRRYRHSPSIPISRIVPHTIPPAVRAAESRRMPTFQRTLQNNECEDPVPDSQHLPGRIGSMTNILLFLKWCRIYMSSVAGFGYLTYT